MKLYPRKLHSLRELKRERYKLRVAIAETDPINTFGESRVKEKADKKEDKKDSNDLLVIVTDLLTSKGVADVALSLADPLLSLLGRKAGKGILKPLAKEVLGGYAKWKLIEIGYKTALRFIRSKQHKAKDC